MTTPKDIAPGMMVEKRTGYKWPGVVVSAFKTLKGETRVVVECTVPEVAGALHIYSPEQLDVMTTWAEAVQPLIPAPVADVERVASVLKEIEKPLDELSQFLVEKYAGSKETTMAGRILEKVRAAIAAIKGA